MAPISIQRDGIRIKGVVKKVLGPVLDMSLLPGVPLTFTDFCVIGLNRCGTFWCIYTPSRMTVGTYVFVCSAGRVAGWFWDRCVHTTQNAEDLVVK